MFRLLLLVTLLLCLSTHAQIDSKKVDSLARVIDSSAKANREQQESVIRSTDSNYQSELKALQHDSSNFSTEQKRKEERKRQQFIVRILTGVLVLLIAVLALVRRKKRNL